MANLRNQPRTRISRHNAIPNRRSRGRDKIKLLKKLLRMILLLTFGGLAWIGWESVPVKEWGSLFPINQVRVIGDIENLDVDKLQNTLQPALNGGYFHQDLGELEGAIRSLAWIDQVRLSRIWPDTLEVDITEQKAVARWGDRALLNPRGERFTADGIETFYKLPLIYGPLGMEANLLEMMNALNDRLKQKGVEVATLDVSKRRACIVKLNNGLEIHFGRQDPVTLLDRFLNLVPKLGDEAFAQLKRVDLRYPNGFAVVWKSAEEINGENSSVSQLNGNAGNPALEK